MTDERWEGDRAALHAANAEFTRPPVLQARPPWWRRNLRWLLLALVADIVVGALLLRWLRDESSTPERAVERAAALVADQDYEALRGALCAPDRVRFTARELADAGRAVHLVMHGVEGFEVDRVLPLPDVSLGPAALPARRVEGRVIALLGQPSKAWVTVVQEPTAWKVCLSAGGYGLAAMSVDEPLAEDLLP